MHKPKNDTLERVFRWLHHNGFSVSGPNEDPETGNFFGGMREFTAKQVVQLVKTREENKRKGVAPKDLSYREYLQEVES